MSQTTRQVRVLLFAGLRERVGREEVEVEVEQPPTVGGLLAALRRAFPELSADLGHARVAVDQAFADADAPIPAHAEVAVIPPVSGGHQGQGPVREGDCLLTPAALSLDAAVAAVRHPCAGGLVTFTGQVRARSRGKTIEQLEYEAYAGMAVRVMAEIAGAVERRHAGVRVAIHHRIGRLQVGETAVIIAVSAAHRAEAFAACRDAIEALKRDVPIWKKEIASDGSEWIGRGP